MTVYKGIEKHDFSQSPAMNFDRSADSLRLNMGSVDKINRMHKSAAGPFVAARGII